GASPTDAVVLPDWLGPTFNMFLFCWACFVVLAGGAIFLRKTRMGLSWLAIRRSERAAAALGHSVLRSKVSAFAASAFVAGGGGGFSEQLRGTLSRRFGRGRPSLTVEAPPPLEATPAPVDTEPVLEITDLTVRYGAVVALDRVTFSVPKRATVGLIGPNGAGK